MRGHRLVSDQDLPIRVRCIPNQLRIWSILSGNALGAAMSNQILVFYGSYRSDRMGIRLAEFLVERLRQRGDAVELIDAKAVNLPMLDRMYKEYPPGKDP